MRAVNAVKARSKSPTRTRCDRCGVEAGGTVYQLASRRVGRSRRPERHLDHKICAGSLRTRCGITADADLVPLTGRLGKGFRWAGYLN